VHLGWAGKGIGQRIGNMLQAETQRMEKIAELRKLFEQLYNNSIESWCERRSAQGLSCNIPSHRCVCLPLFYSQLSLTVCNFTCGIISFVTSCYLISFVYQIFSLL
jgi:hypothetical protein